MFRIEWLVPDSEWQRATIDRRENVPGSNYDKNYGPLYYLLYGDVQFRCEEKTLFKEPINLFVVDLACQLADILGDGFEDAPDGASAKFAQLDDAWEIKFTKENGNVIIETDEKEGPLTVPEDEFFQGTQAFLAHFVSEIDRHAPELLDWHSLSALLPFRSKMKS